ncbi:MULTISPECIES: hypothetical protein [Streptomyces]|uniref:Uncharacterized protein n=1 Tax=Streptomyces nymphaeiformis TaxID=2663842 RepID=A0A7W7U7E9_9ACTN|nr:hypothetical protein [Streptomyces nymphaeiformis]MBB4986319.1 hypothetical protein [Streptomyces nymphaeiformis]
MPLYLAFNDLGALRARCDVAVVRTAKDEAEYEDGAVVPSGRWQPLDDEAGRALAAPERARSSMLVEIVRPPVPTGRGLDDLAKPLGDDRAEYIGQALAEPGMRTTTDNYRDGRLIGLHLDNWDKLDYGRRTVGRRRLALNLGPGDRYVVLGDLDAQAVCRAVHPDSYERRYPHTDDYRTYAAVGHPLGCVRIRLAPGEGYLAPTEYLLHDGSTEGQDKPSAMAFWLGHWSRGILPSLV